MDKFENFAGVLAKRKTHIFVSLIIFFVNYFLDRITKYLAIVFLMNRRFDIRFFNDFFILKYAENTGAFLSLGKDWNEYVKYIVLLVIPIIICIIGLFYLMLKETKTYRIVLGSCIIGGGMGNLVDRLFNNFSVIDFLNFGIGANFRTGILNVADLSVTFGVIILIIFELINDIKGKKEKMIIDYINMENANCRKYKYRKYKYRKYSHEKYKYGRYKRRKYIIRYIRFRKRQNTHPNS